MSIVNVQSEIKMGVLDFQVQFLVPYPTLPSWSQLTAFEKVLFKHAKPKTIILTTPNREYNPMWENLPEGAMRHNDHRFEWTRNEFKTWADRLAEQYNYSVAYYSIGPESKEFGSPTQMGVFKRAN